MRVTFIHADGKGRTEAEAEPGSILLDVAQEDFDRLPLASEMEEDMLDLAAGVRRTSRLACQIVLTDDLDGLRVHIPAESRNMQGPR